MSSIFAFPFESAHRNTILAALRYYQSQGLGDPDKRPDDIHEIATNGGDDISLNDAGIDSLCEAINTEAFERALNVHDDAVSALEVALSCPQTSLWLSRLTLPGSNVTVWETAQNIVSNERGGA